MCDYFTIRQQRMFPSYTIDVKEQAKIDRFLQLLNRSGVAQILDSVKDKNTNMGGRPCYNIYNLFSMRTTIYGFLFISKPQYIVAKFHPFFSFRFFSGLIGNILGTFHNSDFACKT